MPGRFMIIMFFKEKSTWIINDTIGKITHIVSLKAFYLLNTCTNAYRFKMKSKVRNLYKNSLKCNLVHCTFFLGNCTYFLLSVHFGVAL